MATKYATVMFTDIKDFTETTYSQSRKELGKLVRMHDRLVRPLFRKHGGKIVKTIGDSFMVVFSSPTNAVLCGVAIQDTLKRRNQKQADKIEMRIGLSAGEVTAQKGDYFGTPVNVAARVQTLAAPGQVYLTEDVYLSMNRNEIQTAQVGHQHLKGIPEDLKVYRALSDATGWEPKLTERIRGKLPRHRPSMRKVWMVLLPVAVIIIIAALVLALIPKDNSTVDEKVTPQYLSQLRQGLTAAVASGDTSAMQGYLATLEQVDSARIDARTALTIAQAYGAIGDIPTGTLWLDRAVNKAEETTMHDVIINIAEGYMAALNPSSSDAIRVRQLFQTALSSGRVGANTRTYVALQLTSPVANVRRNIYYSFIEKGDPVPGDLNRFFQMELAAGGETHTAGLFALLSDAQRQQLPPPV